MILNKFFIFFSFINRRQYNAIYMIICKFTKLFFFYFLVILVKSNINKISSFSGFYL